MEYPVRSADGEHLRGAAEGMRKALPGGRGDRARRAVLHDETTTDSVERALLQAFTSPAQGGESDGVRMERQGARLEAKVLPLVEEKLPFPEQPQAALAMDRLQDWSRTPGVDLFRILSREPEQDSPVSPVAAPSGRERAEELHEHLLHSTEVPRGLQAGGEGERRSHGPTVCELLGPTPTRNRSSTLMVVMARTAGHGTTWVPACPLSAAAR